MSSRSHLAMTTPFGAALLLLLTWTTGDDPLPRTAPSTLDICSELAEARSSADDPIRAAEASSLLLNPRDPWFGRQAPERFQLCLLTSAGPMLLESRREWAPHGVDRFYNLVTAGYYDDSRIFRVVEDRWAQFGIHGNPEVASTWREESIPDDPPGLSNERGTLAFAFAVPDGRTTQVFFNLGDNSSTLDEEPFVPIARIISGQEVLDRIHSGYGETAGGGIRAGNQDPLFEGGNAFLDEHFPELDRILAAVVVTPGSGL